MSIEPPALTAEKSTFLTERHLATLTTVRPNGSPHVVPVGFGYDAEAGIVRIITFPGSRKVENIKSSPGTRAAVCQVDGGRWLTLEGVAEVTDDPQRVATAVAAYRERYQEPAERPDRVAIEIQVDRILGRA